MIKELSVRPKPKNKIAIILCIATFALSAVLFALYFILDVYRGVLSFAGLCMLVTALVFYTKYVSVAFCYDVTLDADGTAMFVVRQLSGKRSTTVCNVPLYSIVKIIHQTKEERKAYKPEAKVLVYKYTPTMFPPDVYRICIHSRYERAEMIIECNEEFYKILSEYAKEAREKFLAEEAEE